MKIGRNDPCPCGAINPATGRVKKYKKCCLNKSFADFTSEMRQKIFQPETYHQNGMLIGRPMISTQFNGKKVVAVGNRVYPHLPPNITFHEFIITFLKDILTQEWCLGENQKTQDDQHLIIQWIKELSILLRSSETRVEDPVRHITSAPPSGNVQSLLSLAYDIYCIYHCAELPPELIERLKNKDQFQGAKYEIAVAGIFARAGFNLAWMPNSSVSHAEFIATHRETQEKITVEAKSRHRDGVLHSKGLRQELTTMRTRVGKLFNDALQKPDEGNPFLIFIDVNLPLTDGDNTLKKKWADDIRKMLDQHPMGTAEHPDPFTALFVTNFSWHYFDRSTEIKKGELLTVVPMFPKIPLANTQTVPLLHAACEQYGLVPSQFP